MYEVFDDFLRVPTWYRTHGSDDERFFRALEIVVRNQDFNADSLGEYIDQKRRNGADAQVNLSEEAFEAARDRYVAAAWAVRRYLRTIGQP